MAGGTIDISSLQIAGGISHQPAHMRFTGQCEDASNALFSVADGANKRPGSLYVKKIDLTSPYNALYPAAVLVPGSVYRTHPINRDATEKYIVVYAIGCLRVFTSAGDECTVSGLSADASNYFSANSATASQLRLVTIADYTIIANTTVPLGVTTTPTYTLTKEWDDYDQMVSHTPTSLPGSTSINTAGDDSYHKTNGASQGAQAGYWKYDVSGNTFPTIQFAEVTNNPSNYNAFGSMGFKIRFEKRQDTFTGATWTAATRRLVKASTWGQYVHQQGDDVYVASGTGWSAGWYKVARKISASELELVSGSASDGTNVDGAGIGQEFEVEFTGTGGVLPNMHAVAKFIEGKLQDAGAKDALCGWTYTTGGDGYFTITAPWRGSGAKVTTVTTNPSAPSTATTDLSSVAEGGFAPAGAVLVVGGGTGPRTLPPDERWTRVAAPGDADGSIDPAKAPIKLVRASPATSGTITGVSVAANAIITTAAAHGLVAGQVVTIAGTVSSATVVGTFIVTSVPTATTFTIGVNTTGGVSDGTGTFTAPAHFTYDVIAWSNRTSGTDNTNPSPVPFKTALKISDIGFARQRFWILAGEWALGSATADLFRLYLDDANNLVDSDPIAVQLSSDRVTITDFFTPVGKTVLVTTKAGQHFSMGSPEALTPSTVSFTRAFSAALHSVRPAVLDPFVYLPATANGKSQLREAILDEDETPNAAADVSAHVGGSAGDAGLLPSNPQTVCTHPNSGMVFLVAPSSNKIYVYKSMWNGNQKVQSAWSKWAFGASAAALRLSDICVIDDDLFLLTETASQFVLEKVPIFQPALGNYPYNLHMDRQVELTGVHAAGTTTWTLPNSLSDATIDTIVLRTGVRVTVATSPGTTVTATGNFSGAPATLGRSYEFSLTLTEPFLRDREGRAILKDVLYQRQLIVRHVTTGAISVVNDPSVGASATYTLNPPSGSYTSTDQRVVLSGGDMSKRSIIITSSAPTPVTISGITHVGDWGLRSHAGGA